jgi:AcrR family transcriptional regulator
LALADREGVDRLSMRALARELGVSPMALYRHVADKDGLLDGLVESLLAELQLPDTSRPWASRLRELAAEVRALAGRHPETFVLLLRRRAASAGALGPREAVLAALGEAGLDADRAATVERLVSTVVFGFALSEASGRFEGVDVEREFGLALNLLESMVLS